MLDQQMTRANLLLSAFLLLLLLLLSLRGNVLLLLLVGLSGTGQGVRLLLGHAQRFVPS
jgi:hypothetical protein